MRLTAQLSPGPKSPRLARTLVRERYAGTLTRDELGDLELLITELVSNAVRHGEGEIQLRVAVDAQAVRAEVIDDGPGFEVDVHERGVRALGGRGLWFVASLAQRWGVYQGSSHVWFELTRGEGRRRPVRPELGAANRCLRFGDVRHRV
jgi:signal transduction histidine kinase